MLADPNGYIYVCGLRAMEQGVEEAFTNIAEAMGLRWEQPARRDARRGALSHSRPLMAAPFLHEVRIGWADCDPARIAYTGRLVYIALELIDAWLEAKVGADWYRLNLDRNVGTPFVHVSRDFRRPVTPRHRLECEVRLLRYSGRSLRFRVRGCRRGWSASRANSSRRWCAPTISARAREIPEDIACKLRAAAEADALVAELDLIILHEAVRFRRSTIVRAPPGGGSEPRMNEITNFRGDIVAGAEQPDETDGLIATVGERVRAVRQRKGMARRVLSELSGVSQRYLAQSENGDGNISIGLLARIARALDHRIEWLVAAEDPWSSETEKFARAFSAAPSGSDGR